MFATQPKKQSRKYNYVFWLAGLLAVLFAAASIASALVDWDKFKPMIESKVLEATGRKLTIAGKIEGNLFPMTHITARDITMDNVEGGKSPYLLKLSELQIELSPLSLLSGKLDIGNITLVDPDIYLEKISASKNNWQFAPTNGIAADSLEKKSATESVTASFVPVLQLHSVTINNGQIHYTDRQSGGQQNLSSINLSAQLRLADKTGKLDGQALWQSQSITFVVQIKPDAGDAMAMDLNLGLGLADIEFTGIISGVGGSSSIPSADGRMTISGKLNPPISIESRIKYGQNKLAMDDFKISGDVVRANGSVTLDIGDDMPNAVIKLTADSIDAQKLFDLSQSWQAGLATQTKSGKTTKPASIAEKSDAAFSLPVRGQANLAIGKLTHGALAADRVAVQLSTIDGKNIAIQRLAFQSMGQSNVESQGTYNMTTQNFDGKFTANVGNLPELAAAFGQSENAWLKTQSPRLSVDGNVRLAGRKLSIENYRLTHGDTRINGAISYAMADKPVIAVKSELRHPSIKQLSGKPIDIDGKLAFDADVQFQLAGSQIDWLSLQGEARADIEDGVVYGIDLKQISQRMKELNKLDDFKDLVDKAKQGGKTEFRGLVSNWIIARGIAKSNNIGFSSNVVDSFGGGTIDLAKQQMDIRTQSKFSDHPKVPALGIRLFGDIAAPQKEFDTAAIAGYFATRAINKVIEKNVDTEKLKEKLNRSIEKKQDKLLNKLFGQ